jgi:hypothetical protein
MEPTRTDAPASAAVSRRAFGVAALGGIATVALFGARAMPETMPAEQSASLKSTAFPERAEAHRSVAEQSRVGTVVEFASTTLHDRAGNKLGEIDWYIGSAVKVDGGPSKDDSVTWHVVPEPILFEEGGKVFAPDESFFHLAASQLLEYVQRRSHRCFRSGDSIECKPGRFGGEGEELLKLSLVDSSGVERVVVTSHEELKDGYQLPVGYSAKKIIASLQLESPPVASAKVSRFTDACFKALQDVASELKKKDPLITHEQLKKHLVEHTADITATVTTGLSASIEVLNTAGPNAKSENLLNGLFSFSGPLLAQINNDAKVVDAMIELIRGGSADLAAAIAMAGTPAGTESVGAISGQTATSSDTKATQHETVTEARKRRETAIAAALSVPLGKFAGLSVEGEHRTTTDTGQRTSNLTANEWQQALQTALTNNSVSTWSRLRDQRSLSTTTATGIAAVKGRFVHVELGGFYNNSLYRESNVIRVPAGETYASLIKRNRDTVREQRSPRPRIIEEFKVACELHENLSVLEQMVTDIRADAISLLPDPRVAATFPHRPASESSVRGYEIDPAVPVSRVVADKVVDSSSIPEPEIVLFASEVLLRDVIEVNKQKIARLEEQKRKILELTYLLHSKRAEVKMLDLKPELIPEVVGRVIQQCENAAMEIPVMKKIMVDFAHKQGVRIDSGDDR